MKPGWPATRGPAAEVTQAYGWGRWLRGDPCGGARLAYDDRSLPGTHRRPGVVVVAELAPPRPEPITLLAFRGATADGTYTYGPGK